MPCDQCGHLSTPTDPVVVVCPDEVDVWYLCMTCLQKRHAPPVPCDHGHIAKDVRALPLPGDACTFVCYRHYLRELYWRLGGSYDQDDHGYPEWSTLSSHGAQP